MSCHIHPTADACHGKNLFIMKHNQVTGLPVLNVIFLRKEMVISGQKEPPDCAICGVTGQKILHHLTGKTAADLKLPGDYVYESSCIKCHENLFPAKLTKEGEDAHLYYTQTKKTPDLHCINCHLNAGHYMEGYTHGSNATFGSVSSAPKEIFKEPAKVTEFKYFHRTDPKFFSIIQYDSNSGRNISKWEVLMMNHSGRMMKDL